MKSPMHRRTPTVATSSSSTLYRNSPSFFISSSSNDNDSNKEFNFKELLLDPNDIVLGVMIGEGSYSIVHEGLFRDQIPVAVKIITSPVTIHNKEKFQKEVMLLSRMKHDNIVKLVGACIEPRLMIVMEHLEGGTLERFMWNYSPKPLDIKTSLSYALDISQAMEFLHSNGIIHRDLNPRNVLVTGDLKHVKVADFGIAREVATDGMTREAGTNAWMAPEVYSHEPLGIMEKNPCDHKVDVYSFALVFWKLLTNKTPFVEVPLLCIPNLVNQGQRPSLGDIPDEAKSIIESCWAQDSNARPEFKEVTVLLKNLLNSLCSDTSSDETLPEEEAYDADTEYSMNTIVIHDEEIDSEVETPEEEEEEEEKKKKKKMILPFVKMFGACYKPM